jgi:molecular chaperone HtpG
MDGAEMSSRKKSTRKFQAEVSRLLHLVVNSLYSHKEIFLRELVSNASDAIDKLKLAALTEPSVMGNDEEAPSIRIAIDREARTITIDDDGIGMSRDELATNLGTLAHSGTMKFLEQLENRGDANLIGQFGVGFYSSFLVADRVDVTSRPPGEDAESWTWSSDAKETYTLAPGERARRGTTVVLHVSDEQAEFVDEWRLRGLVGRYSDYVSHPIMLDEPRYGDDGEVTRELAQVNKGNALWQRPASEISDDDYNEFYRHLSHDWTEPLARTHFRIEGTQLFTGLLFVPGKPPHDLFLRDGKRGVRLFVNRVFIMDDAEELVPVWLRFVKGVIDSDDLPLNVSREMLQDSTIVRTIRNQVVKKTIALLADLAESEPEKYETFWAAFGAVMKEGLHVDFDQGDKLAPLLRYRSSAVDGLTTLAGYVERMKEGQEAIYYVIAESEAAAAQSPHLEALKQRDFEVLYMTDPIDEWAVAGLKEFDDKPLVSAMKADLDLDETEEDKGKREERQGELAGLLDRFGAVLEDEVEEVRVSARLTESPCCLVVPEGGQHAYLERLLRAQDPSTPKSKRILEVNPTHPVVENLRALHEKDPESDHLTGWIEMLYDQVLLTEGSPVVDPGRLARRMTDLIQQASGAALQG